MAKRGDGKETRKRLLNAACKMFSQNGYTKTRVADICKQACANQASINYYFKDKAGLYIESWQYSVDRFGETLFADMEGCSPQEQLQKYIQNLMNKFTDTGEKGAFSRLYMMELVNPTGLIQDAWYDKIQPNRQKLHQIIQNIMGQTPDRETLIFCELNISSQCRSLLTINPRDMAYFLGQPLDQDLINRMADHITQFSIAGIKALGKTIKPKAP
ncbi:MAG: CerR family C-terminal domain-containing protein [Desulfobacter sp.]|nr:CerR family C-terminal domain-containing protein [Desulfobacter sp.]WDP85048.1 MAG: CerR family C-terminal domain-containing protein [Desulfobacter sp.]